MGIEAFAILKQFIFDAGAYALIFMLALLFFRGSRQRLLPHVMAFFLFVFVVICANFTPHLLARPLLATAHMEEESAQRSHCRETFPSLTVLGGGLIAPDLPGQNAMMRLQKAAGFLLKSFEEKRRLAVVLSGGITNQEFAKSEAYVLAKILKNLVGQDVSLFHSFYEESKSLNTYENAVSVKAKLQEIGLPLRTIIVTNDVHMRRALAVFRTQGVLPCALSAQSSELVSQGLLAFSNGANTVRMLNEHLGYVGYMFNGRIDGEAPWQRSE